MLREPRPLMPTLTKVTDLDLPDFDYADPAIAVEPHEALRRLLAAGHWLVRTPSGYGMLDWADC